MGGLANEESFSDYTVHYADTKELLGGDKMFMIEMS